MDVDIVLEKATTPNGEADGLYVYVRRWADSQNCETQWWPKPGSCVTTSDIVAGCDPSVACLDDIRLERKGIVLAHADLQNFDGSCFIDKPVLQPDSDLELVFSTCRGSSRINLPNTPVPPPVISDVTLEGSDVVLLWSPNQEATVSLGGCSGGFGGAVCLGGLGGETLLRVMNSQGCTLSFYVGLLAGGEEQEQDLGLFRVWRGGVKVLNAFVPARQPDGRWSLPVVYLQEGQTFPLAAVIAGSHDTKVNSFAPSFSIHGDSTLFSFTSDYLLTALPYKGKLDYRAGAQDELKVTDDLAQRTYRTTFPHVVPTNDIVLGGIAPWTFQLAVGPFTLVDDADPSNTLEGSFSIDWAVDVPIVKPVP